MFAASEGSVEWCRGVGVWIYPSSRIDRGGRIYGNACVCVQRRWLCCIARSRRAVHFRGGRSVVVVRPGDVIYLSDGRQYNTAAPIHHGQRRRVTFPTTPICTRRGLYTLNHPYLSTPFLLLFDNPSAELWISLTQTYVRTHHPPTHVLSGTRPPTPPRDINLTCPAILLSLSLFL